MSKFCAKCGTELKDDAVFCPKCGAKVGQKEKQPERQVVKKKSGKNSLIGIGCIGIIVLVLVIFGIGKADGSGCEKPIKVYQQAINKVDFGKIKEALAPGIYESEIGNISDYASTDEVNAAFKELAESEIGDQLSKIRFKVTNKEKIGSKNLKSVLKNKYFWMALLIGVFTLLVNANAIASQICYCNVVLGDPMFMTQLMSLGQLPGIIILFFMPYFSNKFSKRSFMTGGGIVMILGFVLIGLADTNRTLLLVGTVLRSIGIGPMFAGVYAFVADAADYGEWKYGVRSEGLMASSQSIGSKIGIGFGSALTAWILAAVGYVGTPGAEQSQAVISAIRFDYGWLGAILSAALVIVVLFMDVEKYLPQIREELRKNIVKRKTE